MWFLRFAWADVPTLGWVLGRAPHIYRSEDGGEGCAYLDGAPPRPGVSVGVTLVRLQRLDDVAGAACRRDAPWHYVVATDVLPEHDDDFNAWYRDEHLPGLAAVPGTVWAARHRVVEGPGPRYHACYDLAERSAFNSPEWLAVRATPWSARIRPHFRDTRRTMYRRVDPAASS